MPGTTPFPPVELNDDFTPLAFRLTPEDFGEATFLANAGEGATLADVGETSAFTTADDIRELIIPLFQYDREFSLNNASFRVNRGTPSADKFRLVHVPSGSSPYTASNWVTITDDLTVVAANSTLDFVIRTGSNANNLVPAGSVVCLVSPDVGTAGIGVTDATLLIRPVTRIA